jgi:hypothetical protein
LSAAVGVDFQDRETAMPRFAAALPFCAFVAAAGVLAAPAPFPRQQKPGTGLYTDAEIQRLAGKGFKGLRPGETVLLAVVPIGESRPRGEVFRALHLDESRLRDRRSESVHKVIFLFWQAAPSYDLSFMTAINDPENRGLDDFDPRRKVYGVRIRRR